MASQVSLSRRACSLSLSFSLFTFRDNHLSRSTNDIVSVKKKNKKKTVFPFFLTLTSRHICFTYDWQMMMTPLVDPLFLSARNVFIHIYLHYTWFGISFTTGREAGDQDKGIGFFPEKIRYCCWRTSFQFYSHASLSTSNGTQCMAIWSSWARLL